MLTRKQKIVLDFIKSYQDKKEYSPSLVEIQKHFKLASVSTAHFYIEKLQKKGALTKIKNQSRTISLTTQGVSKTIPLLGTIAAGEPIDVFEKSDEIVSISTNDLQSTFPHYALRVKGDSMIDDGIFDGDLLIIRSQQTADNGQTVVAIIDDNRATLKKYYLESDRIRLQPANRTYHPFFRKHVEIRGVVTKVIRSFS